MKSLDDRLGAPIARKLLNVLGPEVAERLSFEVLREIGLHRLRTASDRLLFGKALSVRGGITSVIGRSIATQALLHGASRHLETVLRPAAGGDEAS